MKTFVYKHKNKLQMAATRNRLRQSKVLSLSCFNWVCRNNVAEWIK